MLAQLLKLNGASRVVLAANKGMKMDIARQLDAADEQVENSPFSYLEPTVKLTRNKKGTSISTERMPNPSGLSSRRTTRTASTLSWRPRALRVSSMTPSTMFVEEALS
jgi:threonine dehydrogenase-like Zn-dependent dehydrogenase